MQRLTAAIAAALLTMALAIQPILAAADAEPIKVTITPVTEETSAPNPQENTAPDIETPEVKTEASYHMLKHFLKTARLFLSHNASLTKQQSKELDKLLKKLRQGKLPAEQAEALEQALNNLLLKTETLLKDLLAEENDPITNPNPGGEDDTEQDPAPDEEESSDLPPGDKYLRRVAHLQRIAERAPESAQKGLARAIANALRQRQRAIAKGKLVSEEQDTAKDPAKTFKFKLPKDKKPGRGK